MDTYTIIFNLFYSEIWDRLLQCENLGADIQDVYDIWKITWDVFAWECILTKVVYQIKEWYEPSDVIKELRKLAMKDFKWL